MKILLLAYLNRSGSTYFINQLSKYPEILVCPEAEILVKQILEKKELFALNEQLFEAFKQDAKFKHWKLDLTVENIHFGKNRIDVFISILKAYQRKFKPGASVVVYKALELLGIYPLIKEHLDDYPNIWFASLIRDPRAVFHSQKTSFSELTRREINSNPLIIAYQWQHFVNLCESHLQDKNFFLIQYENLIRDTETVMKDVLNKFGIKHAAIPPITGDLFDRIPADQISLHQNIKDPPDITRIDKWQDQLNPYEIGLIQKVNASNMINYNYPLVEPAVKRFRLLLLKLYYKTLIWLGLNRYY